MMDHYYGVYAAASKAGADELRARLAQGSGRQLEGEEHAAAVKQLQAFANSDNRHSGVKVSIAPPEPPVYVAPPPKVQVFAPQPGVMVRQDIPRVADNPDLDKRITMVDVEVNGRPGELQGGLDPLLRLGAKRDINLSRSLALLGAYNGDVKNLTLRSRVEMGDVHGKQGLSETGVVYNWDLPVSRYHHTPKVNFSVQTVDGGTIDIQLSIEEFINESGSYSGHMDPRKGMSRTLAFTMETQGTISQAAWEGLAPMMESLDAMINTFNTDQVLQQSDVDAFSNQMAERQDLFSSAQLSLNMELSEAMYRKIQINSGEGNTTVSADEKAMAEYYQAAVVRGAHTMQRVNGDFDREAFAQLSPDNPEAFYLPAISSDWDTDYENLFRFMHSFLEE